VAAERLAFQFHGSSACRAEALVRPETMRSSTSVGYVIGSTPFSLAVWISVMAIASDAHRHRYPRTGRSCGERDRPDDPLDDVGVHLDPAIVEIGDQPRPVLQRVADGFRQVRGGRDTSDMLPQPGMQGLHNGPTSCLPHLPSVLGEMAADLGLATTRPGSAGRMNRRDGGAPTSRARARSAAQTCPAPALMLAVNKVGSRG
jgi:hypothetical protein